LAGVILAVFACGAALPAVAHADNTRLNNSVVANVYTIQHQAGCTNDVAVSPQLRLAAEWHANDVLNNRDLDGDLGSEAAGFRGKVFQTVAINRSIAINNLDVLNQWYYDPPTYAIMANCANTVMGVWSENSPDRSVVVALYGQPGA